MISVQHVFELIDSTSVFGLATTIKGSGYLPMIEEYCTAHGIVCGTISEKIYVFRNNMTCIRCECGSGKNRKYVSYAIGYSVGCGAKCPVLIQTQTAKRVDTLKKNGGVGFARRDILEKSRKTTMKEYGVDNISASDTRKKEMIEKNPMFSETIRNKVRNTVFAKYGVGCVFENSEVKTAIQKTNVEKYGVENAGSLTIDDALAEKMRRKYNTFQQLFSIQPLFTFDEYRGIGYTYLWKCVCGNVFEQELSSNRLYPICRICEPVKIGRSRQEIEIFDFVKTECEDVVHNVRNIIDGELDIYVPSKKLAIEFCGAYWHSERFDIDVKKHFTKWKQCEIKGIQLLTIFDDEYGEKKEAVLSFIKNKLGKNTKIYARKCIVKPCSVKDAREFFCKNHLQGFANSTYHYGLFLDDALVSCISFSTPRKGIGKNGGGFELVRFASETGVVVVGGFSKLLRHFVEEVSPSFVYSYSDNRYSNGWLYEKNGFLLDGEVVPRYRYLNPRSGKLEHRFKYAKFKLVGTGGDSDMSERQIMEERGFFRVWDCGKKKWRLDIR